MVYQEQALGEFLAARQKASEMLKEQGAKRRGLSLDEALVLQAASHLLIDQESFYGLEVGRLTNTASGSIYPLLDRFERRYGLFQSRAEDSAAIPTGPRGRMTRPPRRFYTPTSRGAEVLVLFQQNPHRK